MTRDQICLEMFSIENCVETLKDELKTSKDKAMIKKEIKFQQKRYSSLKSKLRSMENLSNG